jgi:hypothetical protein
MEVYRLEPVKRNEWCSIGLMVKVVGKKLGGECDGAFSGMVFTRIIDGSDSGGIKSREG